MSSMLVDFDQVAEVKGAVHGSRLPSRAIVRMDYGAVRGELVGCLSVRCNCRCGLRISAWRRMIVCGTYGGSKEIQLGCKQVGPTECKESVVGAVMD
jgi:hypothetical protein